MYTGPHSGVSAYRDVRAGGAHGASPHGVVLMMLDGVLMRVATARGHIERGEVSAKAESLSRALAIVEALRLALDHERGGDIADNLGDLYEYVSLRITQANLHSSVQPLEEAAALLGEVRQAWAAIAPGVARP